MSKSTQQPAPATASPLISRQWLSERWGISEPTIIRMEQRGELTPVRLAKRVVRYRLAEIEAYEQKANS